MNIDIKNKHHDDKDRAHPYFEGDSISVPTAKHSSHSSRITRLGNRLRVPPGSALASNLCLKSGRPVQGQVHVAIRNPLNPLTWFWKTGDAIIGLSPRKLDDFRSIRILAWSTILVGLIVSLGSSFMGQWSVAVVSGVAIFFGLVLRSVNPIWSISKKDGDLLIQGCGKDYLSLFPEDKSAQ